jgi:hypothetical protein
MSTEQIAEILYQALETERGGIQVYTTALRCVQNPDLRKEWASSSTITLRRKNPRCSRAPRSSGQSA